MRILYLGNMNGRYDTTIDTLTPLLRTLATVKAVSPFQNKALRLLHMLGAVLRAKRSDLVLIDTYSTLAFYYAWACAKICRWRGVNYIPYLHGGNLPHRMDNNAKWLNAFFSGASDIITPSGYLKEAVERRGFSRVRFIYNFIHLQNYPFRQRNAVRPRLLWVRSLHQLYHPEMAIRVIAALRKTFKDAELCMVGPDKDGSLANCKALAARLGVEDSVRFTGRLSKDKWVLLSASYDIFINTTNYDNMPVSVIEAMALGLPVVSTNVGGVPYLLNHTKDGLLIEKNDHRAMAAQIARLVEEPALARQLSVSARQKAASFDWREVKNSWLEIIHKYA